MARSLPRHIRQLRAYLLQPSERNEDLAIGYFRHVYGESFKRQSDAANADGYVPGHLILELKGNSKNWYAGLFQALAYERSLAFSIIVVCAKGFLAAWRKVDLPDAMRELLLTESTSPSTLGRKYARKYSGQRKSILQKAIWFRPELTGDLFVQNDRLFLREIREFERTLNKQKKVRQAISLRNFTAKLKEMSEFFDSSAPIKAVRAFYTLIYGPWDETSVLTLSQRYDDRATLGGVEITSLRPGKRTKFKAFVENHCIKVTSQENIDDFFSRYDEALDAVDKDFRIRHGIFFTDLDLSKFVMWLVKQNIPDLGRNYLVIDPACGSGNLVTNWRSPLQLRHKVVSEIEPELLYAIEQRMQGD